MKSEREVAQSCPTLSDPIDCSLLGSSAHGIFQARVLEWGAIAFSKIKLARLNVGKGVREGEVQKKETGTLQEQITFNEARRGSSQIIELLYLSKKRVSIYRHVCGKLLAGNWV